MRSPATTVILVLLICSSIAIASSADDAGNLKSVTTATSAIKGAEDSPAGETYGVVGTSASAAGAGIGAANLAGGADLVLDGSSDGQIDALLYHHQLDRPSAGPQTFDFVNSGGGGMGLMIDGIDVVTTATDRDTLGVLMCSPNQIPLWNGGTWTCIDRPAPRDPGIHLALIGNTLNVEDGHGSGLDADTLDGLEGGYYARNLQRVVTVSAFGGDFATVQGALDSITDAAAENRYLVKIGPGVFYEQVTMKPYVDIEGSGQDVTVLRWGGGGTHDGAISGADHAELRQLTVERDGGSTAVAMLNESSSPTVTHVTLRASGGAINVALGNTYGGAPTLNNCRLEATGGLVGGATNNGDGTPTFNDVVIDVDGSSPYGVRAVQGSSPVLRDVDITVVGDGSLAAGVVSVGSHPSLRSCTVSVAQRDGATLDLAYGINAEDTSTVEVVDTDITVANATVNTGVHLNGSRLELAGSRIRVSGPQPTGIHAEIGATMLSQVEMVSTEVNLQWPDDFTPECPAVLAGGARIEMSNCALNMNLAYCGSGVTIRSTHSSDWLFLKHSYITGDVSLAAGASALCLAVSNYYAELLFFPNTCP